MVATETLADGSRRYRTERGWAEFRVLAPGVALICHQGYAEEALVEPVMRELTTFAGDRPFEVFADLEQLRKYDTEFRSRWVSWLQDRPQKFHVYFLVRSALVAVAVQIAQLVLEDAITSFTDREEFEATLRRVSERARGGAAS